MDRGDPIATLKDLVSIVPRTRHADREVGAIGDAAVEQKHAHAGPADPTLSVAEQN